MAKNEAWYTLQGYDSPESRDFWYVKWWHSIEASAPLVLHFLTACTVLKVALKYHMIFKLLE